MKNDVSSERECVAGTTGMLLLKVAWLEMIVPWTIKTRDVENGTSIFIHCYDIERG